MMQDNLLQNLPTELADELVETLLRHGSVRIERIISCGQHSPPGFWYDQQEHEWVAVLTGEAKLVFAGLPEPVHLKAGDHVNIPARCRHRVEWTTPTQPTVWLAVFYSDVPVISNQ